MVDSIKINGEQEWEYGPIQATEDGTPRSPVDADGGFSEVTVEVPERQRTRFAVGEKLDLAIGEDGVTQGDIYSVDINNGWASVKAFGLASVLDCERTALPFEGTAQQALEYYFGLAGYTGKLVIASSLASKSVNLLGFYGNLFDFVNKSLCPFLGAEMTQVGDEIIFRPAGTRSIDTANDTSRTLNVEANKEYSEVTVNYYVREWVTNKMIFPASHTDVDYDQIISVDSGETTTKEFDMNASVASIVQPKYNQNAKPLPSGDASEFCVVDKNGKVLTNSQWRSGGGALSVEIGEDTRTLSVTVTGPKYTNRGPFKVGFTAGNGEEFPTLRIAGTGLVFNGGVVTVPTPADPERASVGDGVTIDDACIDSLEQAYQVASQAASTVSGNSVTMSVDSASLGSNAIGNVAGARYRNGDAIFRVASASVSESGWSYSAIEDTTYRNFESALGDLTYEEFELLWGDETYSDFTTAPLRGTLEVEGSGFGVTPFGVGPFGQ